ncbi:uncharacterized protein LOC120164609 [Hibiscus syriacus]|uniref:uncharacterized protein LOC120164609 n=1 Tax=Hibiscus syriacus TaxID=106335 RepID=UPI001920A1EF|nr:uncharacterized protein LOC120164609 [Hibiscus syriacus]
MAILDRLPTVDRLSRIGIVVNGGCRNCGNVQELRNHIFFGYVFAREVWEIILGLCRVHREVRGGDEELGWAVSVLKGKSLIVCILKVVWCAYTCYIWEERNCR